MPTGREPLLDAVVLAAQGAVVERDFSVADFTRLCSLLADPSGFAHAELALQLQDAVPVGKLVVTADVTVVCQRCLQPMLQRLHSESALAFRMQDGAPASTDQEVIAGDPKRIDLAALVEDELLLALPAIPRHAAGESCRLPSTTDQAAAAEAPEMRRPFAGLKDLLKH